MHSTAVCAFCAQTSRVFFLSFARPTIHAAYPCIQAVLRAHYGFNKVAALVFANECTIFRLVFDDTRLNPGFESVISNRRHIVGASASLSLSLSLSHLRWGNIFLSSCLSWSLGHTLLYYEFVYTMYNFYFAIDAFPLVPFLHPAYARHAYVVHLN